MSHDQNISISQGKQQPRFLPPLDPFKSFGWDKYLPIEEFRKSSAILFKGTETAKTFLSSGTTKESFAESPFSDLGLTRYTSRVLDDFSSFLEKKFFRCESPRQILPIYSLVPPPQRAPSSSLSFMLEALVKNFGGRFIDELEVNDWILRQPSTAISLFGTGFQFVSLYDKSKAYPLPRGSCIIETGGFKGLSRKVDSKSYYEFLSEIFKIPQNQIYSEYSMCELSCQAYGQASSDSLERGPCFRFSPSVKVYVMREGGALYPSGRGALVVFDHLRSDFPWPIRTQDFVDLSQDGSFFLLGRLPGAVLKGCSLSFEAMPQSHLDESVEKKVTYLRADDVSKRYDFLKYLFDTWLYSPLALKKLADIAGSLVYAKRLTDQTLEGFLETRKSEINGNLNGSGDRKRLRKLVICSSSHGFVLFKVFIKAFLDGEQLLVRLPGFPLENLSYIKQFGALLNTFLPGFLLWTREGADFEDIVRHHKFATLEVYGSSQTIENLSQRVSKGFEGHGSFATAAVCSIDEFGDQIEKICFDVFCLRQRGCRSVKILFVKCPGLKINRAFFQDKIRNELDETRFNEANELELTLLEEIRRADNTLDSQDFPYVRILDQRENSNSLININELLSLAPMALTVVLIDSEESLKVSADLRGIHMHILTATSDQNGFAQSWGASQLTYGLLGESQKTKW